MQDEYPLSPDEQAELQTYIVPIQSIQHQMNAALRLIIRQQKLEGTWTLNAEGTKLVRTRMIDAAL